MANKTLAINEERARNQSKYLSDRYGGTSKQWQTASTISLLGADAMDSFDSWANASMAADAIEGQQKELKIRAGASLSSISSQADKVQAAQASAFIKGGVKLEGSALNVLNETANQALKASQVEQREADMRNTQLEVEKRMRQVQADAAPMNFLLGAASTLAGAHAAGAKGKSGGKAFAKNDAAVDPFSSSSQQGLQSLEQFRSA